MNDAARMRKCQRLSDALEQLQALAQGKPIDIAVERLAFNVFHAVEGAPVRQRAGVMHGNNAGMFQARQDDGLLHQPRGKIGGAVFRGQHFERHRRDAEWNPPPARPRPCRLVQEI